ncbi:prepilin-type N-terminal cleavage/methylation domain-containing protein [Lysobacter sp. KIS68-7]|uniref:GspH/FimT family pseudopilin n=1 Tax=Lysobacter sp. KIS68-7 TaxID=2904252 RepID=UPI001E30A29E|nr:GspH/FimT family pseudopilin [Lysobacter sp. KIS68-7]UHQ19612.1 prepilin-type N-terminal cleavage/methylation domain-containing protein [Lysobacter sp. KIS68-7]
MPVRRNGGFTLLELMVAVGIFLLLTALAVPSFQTYFEKARVRGAADGVVAMIANARQAAVKFDRNVSVATTGSGATWCLGAREAAVPAAGDQAAAAADCDCSAASPTTCMVDGQEQLVGSSAYPGISLSSPASSLTFDGRLGMRSDADTGNADASSFDLTSSPGRYTLTVSVSPLGQATVCSKSGSILGYPSC